MLLRLHDHHLREGDLELRPLTEEDWPHLLRWNQDPEVLYFSEGGDVTAHSLATVKRIYRGVSQRAFVFLLLLDGTPIGEGWLQQLNLERILCRHSDTADLRRIDLMIGEKQHWGHGFGTRAIALLTELGFDVIRADALFACDIADYNPRSRRAFEKNGYDVFQIVPREPGGKAREVVDLILTQEAFQARRAR